MEYYATLAQARNELKAGIADTSDDSILLSAVRFASARISAETGRRFWPYVETVTYDALGFHVGPYHLDVNRDLLEVTTLTNTDDTTISSAAITLAYGNTWPKYRIRLLRSSGVMFTPTSYYEDAIEVVGVWGFHSRYNEAWQDTGLTVQGSGISSSATSITASSSSAGNDVYGIVPVLSPGNLIRVDSEYMVVTAADGITLTVQRGANGSTAASHDADTAIEVFYPEPAITRAVLRWASYLYARRGEFAQTTFDGVGVTTFPPDMPAEIEYIIAAYRRKEVYVL